MHQANSAIENHCRWICGYHGNASVLYLSLLDRRSGNIDIMPYMANDCRYFCYPGAEPLDQVTSFRYLSCLSSCRKPHFKRHCGDRSSLLEEEALRTVFASSWDLYEPPEIRPLLSRGFHSSFPRECRDLATLGQVQDIVPFTAAPEPKRIVSDSKPRMTRVVFALSSDGFSSSPVTCSFEDQLQGTFFSRFCASAPGFSTFTKLQYGSVYVNMSSGEF